MVVVFSLGIPPLYIARILALPALFMSLLLLFNYLMVTPYIKIISANFIDQKKAEAKFNLSASEFGHNFGSWMLFINESDNEARSYGDIVLFSKEMKDEILIYAKDAELINDNGVLQFKLKSGESYSYNDKTFKQMLFDTAYINDTLRTDPTIYLSMIDYWTNEDRRDKKDRLLVTNTLLSLFPLLSIFLIVALGIVHARHQKRWIYLWLFLSIVGFYASSFMLQKWFSFHAIWVVSLLWLALTYTLYRRLVGQRF